MTHSKYRIMQLALAFTVTCTTLPALADQALANAKGCLACHDLKVKKVGPAYLDVAKKYAGQKDAPAKLTQKILNGGSGSWGEVAMPANRTMGVTEADAKKLANWVLSLK